METTKPQTYPERVLRDMSSAVLVLNRTGNIVYMNFPASLILEIEDDDEERPFSSLVENAYNDKFSEAVFNALYHKNDTTIRRVPFMSPSGKKYVLLMSCSYLLDDSEGAELVITLTDETAEEVLRRKVRDSSFTFSTFLFAFCGWILFYALWEFLNWPFPADLMTHGVEVLGLVMLFFILRYTSLSWKDLGIRADHPWKTVRTALVVAACAFMFLFVLKAVIRIFVPTSFEPDAPFFDISRFGLRQVLYVFTAGIQEFLARSVMQSNLKRITTARHKALFAILLSSFIFAALHIHFGFLFMLGAAILAGLEGILYEKQQNIFGVWIVHWVFGVSGTLLCLIDH